LPKVIVDERSQSADEKSNPKPNRLPLYEEIDVPMAAASKRAGAKKHHDADDK
jgi:hypothetical protein